MTSFLVTQDCLALGLRAGAFLLRGVQITEAPVRLRAAIDREAGRIRREFQSLAEIRSLPDLARVREILRTAGVNPKHHPPSTLKLLEFAWQRQTLPSINNLVDAYNLISLLTKCSLGAHDLGQIALPVELRLFRGTETFRPLGSEQSQAVREGEFGYVDAHDRVICRLDSIQADFSKVTSTTTDVLVIVESTTAHSRAQLGDLIALTAAAIQAYSPGVAEIVDMP